MPSFKSSTFGVAAMLSLGLSNAFVVSNVPPTPPAAIEKIVPATEAAMWSSSPSNLNLNSQMLLAAAASTNIASGSGIMINDIRYDGDVPKTEADEYVIVKNTSKEAVDVSGYYIYVASSGTQGPTFYFPKGSSIRPQQSVRIYTNEIHKETGGYSFGSGKALWNNNGGLAVLKDNNGKKIMEYKYKPAPKA